MQARSLLAPAAALAVMTHVAPAAVTPIGPFTGAYTDTFNQFGSTNAVQSLPVFGGLGAIENLDVGGAIKIEFSSSLGGDLVVPMSGMMMGQLGVAQWVFDEPVTRFGGWWENNSGVSDATVAFYDADDALLDEAIATIPVTAQQWTWNGWQFDTPVRRIVVTGNGLVNGFLWYENMQLDLVECVADADGNGTINVDDLLLIIIHWGTSHTGADVDNSGVVDVEDLVLVILNWGDCAAQG